MYSDINMNLKTTKMFIIITSIFVHWLVFACSAGATEGKCPKHEWEGMRCVFVYAAVLQATYFQ